ncbi:type 2 lanthipeptide synthetase LanM family protein [Ligilactobacillus murinus]|nr:type 2 lanthipeptide synthetase LanM family protein [Ligilactobacillus murinus]
MSLPFKKINDKLVQKFFKKFLDKFVSSNNYFSSDAVNDVKDKITESVHNCTIKVLVSEIHNSRNFKVMGAGDSSNKYKRFNNYFSTNEGINLLLARYPLLHNQLVNLAEDLKLFISEFCKRYLNDRILLRKKLGVSGKICDITFMGDRHNGKQNIKLRFEKGELLYKSHSLANDVFLQELISILDIKWNISLPKTINMGKYGWQMAVNIGNTGSDYERIYYEFGVLSALAYVYDITDLHKENIIISNNDVYVVDVESMLQIDFLNIDSNKSLSATEKINKCLRNSILASDLYPITMSENDDRSDISGITGTGGKVLKNKAQNIFNSYSSDIYIRYGDYITPVTYNKPYKIDPRDYLDSVVEGCNDALKFIINNKDLFIDKFQEGYLKIKTRMIFRNTSEYGQILRILNNPKYLGEVDCRQGLFDKIRKNSLLDPVLSKIVDAELDELSRGNIPYFLIDHNTGKVIDTKENAIIEWDRDILFDKVKKKIKYLDNDQIEFQKNLITIALAKPIKNWDMGDHIDIISDQGSLGILECRNQLKFLAEKMMDSVIEAAVYSDDTKKCSWMKLGITTDNIWTIGPMTYSLYDGIPGVILSIAYVYKISGKEKYKVFCEKAVSELEHILDELVVMPTECSVFNGIGGLVYTYYTLSKIFKSEIHYKKRYIYWLKELLDNVDKCDKLDFLDGISGVLTLITRIYLLEKNQELIPHIKLLQNRLLLERKLNFENKKIWESDIMVGHYLNGFSHGISGIMYGIAVSYKVISSLRIYECVEEAIKIENMSLVEGNWIDLRNRENRLKKNFPDPIHWCHGAPGIGIGRIGIYNSLKLEKCSKDIDIAFKKTVSEGFNGCDSLCHGDFGNLELLLEHYLLKRDTDEYKSVLNVAVDLIKNKNDIEDFVYGIPQKNVISYGLMTGISGIIYQLLRLADPNKVPSILNMSIEES